MPGVLDREEFDRACQIIARHDDVLLKVMEDAGPLVLEPDNDHFWVLCGSIIGQQLSMKAYSTILARFRALFSGEVGPAALLDLGPKPLRSAGISDRKVEYLEELARYFLEGAPPFGELEDEAIIGELVRVRGIGRWTAEMFLIFALNRSDVLPLDDLGLRKGMGKLYRINPDNREAMAAEAEEWRPYRTVGTLYVWNWRDNSRH